MSDGSIVQDDARLLLLLVLAVGGSATAIAAAIGRSELSVRLLRFALLPAAVATGALALGLLAALVLTALIFAEAPQVGSWPPLHAGALALLLAAALLAGFALRRGLRPARDGSSPAGA